jgi:hypothetical protein
MCYTPGYKAAHCGSGDSFRAAVDRSRTSASSRPAFSARTVAMVQWCAMGRAAPPGQQWHRPVGKNERSMKAVSSPRRGVPSTSAQDERAPSHRSNAEDTTDPGASRQQYCNHDEQSAKR